jgi:hypothetical protein
MNWELDGGSPNIEQALAGDVPQRVGWFRFYFADQRWEWSYEVQRIHGYEPCSVTPTTDLFDRLLLTTHRRIPRSNDRSVTA